MLSLVGEGKSRASSWMNTLYLGQKMLCFYGTCKITIQLLLKSFNFWNELYILDFSHIFLTTVLADTSLRNIIYTKKAVLYTIFFFFTYFPYLHIDIFFWKNCLNVSFFLHIMSRGYQIYFAAKKPEHVKSIFHCVRWVRP